MAYEGEFFEIIKISKEYITCIYYLRSDINKFITCLICKYWTLSFCYIFYRIITRTTFTLCVSRPYCDTHFTNQEYGKMHSYMHVTFYNIYIVLTLLTFSWCIWKQISTCSYYHAVNLFFFWISKAGFKKKCYTFLFSILYCSIVFQNTH